MDKVEKLLKNDKSTDAVTILEKYRDTGIIVGKSQEREINIALAAYNAQAKDKLERKLKSGIIEKTARSHQDQIDNQEQKRITEKSNMSLKIKKFEDDKQKLIDTLQSKLNQYESKLEVAKREYENIKQSLDDKMEAVEKQIESIKTDYDNKIERQEAIMTNIDTKIDNTIQYFRNALENCYEPIVANPAIPISLLKKIEEQKEVSNDVASKTKLINIIKSVEPVEPVEPVESYKPKLYEPKEWEPSPDQLQKEAELKIRREQARADDARLSIEMGLPVPQKTNWLPEVNQSQPIVKPTVKHYATEKDKFLDSLSFSDRMEYDAMDVPNQERYILLHVPIHIEPNKPVTKKPVKQCLSYRPNNAELGPNVTTYPKPLIEEDE